MAVDDVGWLRVTRTCNNACGFCSEADELDGRAVEAADLVMAMQRHARAGGSRVTLSGGEPTLSPHLLTLLQAARRMNLATTLVTNGRALGSRRRLALLREAGLDELHVSLHGATAHTHDGLVGAPGAFAQTLQTLRVAAAAAAPPLSVRTVVSEDNLHELGAILRLLSALGVRHWQLRDVALRGSACRGSLRGVDGPTLLAALDGLLAAATDGGLWLRLQGFERLRGVYAAATAHPPLLLTEPLLELLRQGIRPSSIHTGVRLRAADGTWGLPERARIHGTQELAWELRALGVPALDPSGPLLEARRWEPTAAGARVVVLAGPGADAILHSSTLPSLADELARLGARVQLVSPFDPGRSLPELLGEAGELRVDAQPHGEAVPEWLCTYLRGDDLSSATLVVANDFTNAMAVLESGKLAPDARLVIADFHMLFGMNRWIERYVPAGGRARDGGWWPDTRLFVHSCFPGYLHLYRNYGIPCAQLHFNPYSMSGSHFAVGPAPEQCEVIHSGGNHLRDLSTLREALERLPEGAIHPVELFDQHLESFEAPNVRFQGSAELLEFYRRQSCSRFSVVPLTHDPNRAAGVTVMVMALMAGRPVIATDIPATRDHLREDVDSLWVPARDPAALADAIERLDRDGELLSRLAAGVRESRTRVGVRSWARQLLGEQATTDATGGHLERSW